MDGTLLFAGLWTRFRPGRSDERWEELVAGEVERACASGDRHVKLMIPAMQSDLGRRLEFATGLMKEKGYRLHMVTPGPELLWAAGYERGVGGTNVEGA